MTSIYIYINFFFSRFVPDFGFFIPMSELGNKSINCRSHFIFLTTIYFVHDLIRGSLLLALASLLRFYFYMGGGRWLVIYVYRFLNMMMLFVFSFLYV